MFQNHPWFEGMINRYKSHLSWMSEPFRQRLVNDDTQAAEFGLLPVREYFFSFFLLHYSLWRPRWAFS